MSRSRRRPSARGRRAAQPAAPRVASRIPLAVAGTVFLVAFAVRLVTALWLRDLPIVQTPQLDSAQYYTWAGWVGQGQHVWPQPIIQGPAYPYFLALLLWLTGGSLAGAAILQGALGAGACVITAALARRWFDTPAGLAAGLLQAVYGPLAFVETSLYCEGLLIFTTLVAMHAFATRRASSGSLFIAGVLFGVAAIVRSTALALIPVCALVLFVESPAWRTRLRRAGMLLFGVAVITIPVAAKNASDPSGSFQLQGFAGLNFYIGNAPAGSGTATFRLGSGWDTLAGEAVRNGVEGGAREDRYYLRKTFGEIAGRPLGWLQLLARKAGWSLQADEIRDSLSFAFFADAVPLLRWLPGFGVLLALAVAGGVVTIPRRQAPLELLGWIVAVWATIVLLVVGLRYRLPIVPPLAMLGGAGLVALFDVVRANARQRVAALAGVFTVVFAMSHVSRHAPSHALAEEWAFTGAALNSERRLPEAEAAYRRALELDDRNAFAWKGLGIVLYNGNRLEEASSAQQRAIALDPGFADAYLRLAYVEGRLGHLAAGVDLLRKALAILPNDLALRRALGQHLFAVRDYAGAVRELDWVLTRNPADETVAGMLADARRRLR